MFKQYNTNYTFKYGIENFTQRGRKVLYSYTVHAKEAQRKICRLFKLKQYNHTHISKNSIFTYTLLYFIPCYFLLKNAAYFGARSKIFVELSFYLKICNL